MTPASAKTQTSEPSRVERKLSLELGGGEQLRALCGELDANLKFIEANLQLQIANRGERVVVVGDQERQVELGCLILQQLAEQVRQGRGVSLEKLHLRIRELSNASEASAVEPMQLHTPRVKVAVRSANQQAYLKGVNSNSVQFGVGPAGTGKTFLAVAAAVMALQEGAVERIVLVRPAVEAGEKLGFLPGDLHQKINPYLQPLYDALYTMLGRAQTIKLQEQGEIEVAPLAYMRGRTLARSFIILDESQNTTIEQMKMFLTRIGYGSRAVVTGDDSQIDLPGAQKSGLVHALRILRSTPGIGITRFAVADVVRHSIVQRIIEAYEHDSAQR